MANQTQIVIYFVREQYVSDNMYFIILSRRFSAWGTFSYVPLENNKHSRPLRLLYTERRTQCDRLSQQHPYIIKSVKIGKPVAKHKPGKIRP